MGTGYTRNDTLNNIADGNIINASDLDGEFDAVESAFNESTGHTHDGTAAEGAPITVLGPVQDFIASATEIKPKTTNTLDIGTVSLQFKDMHLDGTAYLDDIQAVGAVDITGDLDVDNININGNTISSTDTNGNINLVPNGTGEVNLTDNDKLTFGAGSDLQIYHDGTHSRIYNNTGSLYIQASDDDKDIYLMSDDGSGGTAIYIAVDGSTGATSLRHYGSTKIATTSTGIDVTGDATFADNGKAVFGAGSDLQIYHDGSHSYIHDNGTGDLFIRGSSNVYIQNSGGGSSGAQFVAGGAANINYAGVTKLATTATGVNVTGTVTADGLTVDGGGTNFPITVTSTDQYAGITFVDDTTTNSAVVAIYADGDELGLEAGNAERFRIDSSGNVGIGITSPTALLDVYKASQGGNSTFRAYGPAGQILWANGGASTSYLDSDTIVFRKSTDGGNTEHVRIDSSGNVGIGTSSPEAILHISTGGGVVPFASSQIVSESAGNNYIELNGGSTSTTALYFGDSSDQDVGGVLYNHNVDSMSFRVNASSRMTIDSSGNVGIGTSSPTGRLNLVPVGNIGGSGGTMTNAALRIGTTAASSMYFDTNEIHSAETLNFFSNGTDNSVTDYIRFSTGGTGGGERMRIDSSGNLLVGYTSSNGAYKLQVNSQIFATSATIATSDGNYKENVTPLDGALSLVSQLNPVQFDWKEHPVHEFDRNQPTIGFIAQEVQQVLAEQPYLNSIVKSNECVLEPEETDDEGNVVKEAVTEPFLGIAEGNMVALLTAAIKEQQATISSLETRLAALEAN